MTRPTKAAAETLGVKPSTLRHWASLGCPYSGGGGREYTREVITWLLFKSPEGTLARALEESKKLRDALDYAGEIGRREVGGVN